MVHSDNRIDVLGGTGTEAEKRVQLINMPIGSKNEGEYLSYAQMLSRNYNTKDQLSKCSSTIFKGAT